MGTTGWGGGGIFPPNYLKPQDFSYKFGYEDHFPTYHLPTYCCLSFNIFVAGSEKIKIQSRPYSDANLLNLINELDNVDWDGILLYDDPNNCLKKNSRKIDSLYAKCFPKKVKFVSSKRLKNRWITQDIKRLINVKSETCKKWRMGLINKAENNSIKNRINSQVKWTKTKYYTDSLQVHRNNMKKILVNIA